MELVCFSCKARINPEKHLFPYIPGNDLAQRTLFWALNKDVAPRVFTSTTFVKEKLVTAADNDVEEMCLLAEKMLMTVHKTVICGPQRAKG